MFDTALLISLFAEVQFFHAFNLVTDRFEVTGVTIKGYAVHNVIQRFSDCIVFFCNSFCFGIIGIGCSYEYHLQQIQCTVL